MRFFPHFCHRPISFTLAVAGIALLSGCAFSKTSVKIQLTPAASNPLPTAPTATLQVTEVKDERLKSDPRAVWQKSNAYGKTSGAFVADRPVADLFRDAVETALRTNSFRLAADGPTYDLKAQIKELNHDTMQTSLFSTIVVSKLTVRFELLDSKTGEPVWQDTFTGKSEDKPGRDGTAFVEENFKIAAEDVLNQMVSSRWFRKLFAAAK